METATDSPYILRPEVQKDLDFTRQFIGNTPLFEVRKAFSKPGVKVFLKLEWQQLGGSVKTRPAFSIIENALRNGALRPGMRILDSSSGNTAISYAAIGASLGYPVTVLMSETSTKERSTILNALGAEIIYTEAAVTGVMAQQMALELSRQNPELYFYANQYGNDHNWQAHYHTTAEEIWQQTEGTVTHFAAALGTTGTLMGTGRRLKELNPNVKLYALQPDVATHTIDGWRHLESSVPPDIYDALVEDGSVPVSTEETYEWIKIMAKTEGMLLSPSSAGAVAGAIKIAQSIDKGVVVTVLPDSADKYGEVLDRLFGRL
jgi:cysteine synthase B